MKIAESEAGENAALEGAIDPQMADGGVVVHEMTADPENDRPVEEKDERQEDQKGTDDPLPPGPRAFSRRLAEFIHVGGNLFPRG